MPDSFFVESATKVTEYILRPRETESGFVHDASYLRVGCEVKPTDPTASFKFQVSSLKFGLIGSFARSGICIICGGLHSPAFRDRFLANGWHRTC